MVTRLHHSGLLRHYRALPRFLPREERLKIYGWVILDTHVHAILAAPELSAVLRDLKSFSAKELLAQLETGARLAAESVELLSSGAQATRHQVWQEGSHPQAIMSDVMMEQKLEYLHNNPVKRGFVASPEHWRYSSAHEWLPAAQPLLRCDDWR